MWFLNSQSYTLPAMVSVMLHGILLYFIAVGWHENTRERKIQLPRYVPAELVQLEKTAPKAAPKPKPKTIDLTAQQRERERLKKQADSKRKAEQAKQKAQQDKQKKEQAERERREREIAEQQRREQELLQQEINDALAEEEALLQSQDDAALANSFSEVIYSRVYQNWSYPPSTRKGMHCEISMRLVPTGRVVSVTITKGSGNAAFDRSAEQAVWKAEQFPELKELPSAVFEQYFRETKLIFEPQDTRL